MSKTKTKKRATKKSAKGTKKSSQRKVDFRSIPTHLQYFILKTLDQGASDFPSIHSQLIVTAPAVYQALRPLERKSLIRVDRSKPRNYSYHITAKGKKEMLAVEKLYAASN